MLLPWWTYGLIANLAIARIEYVNVSAGAGASWVATLPSTALWIVLAQWALFRSFSGAPGGLLVAWAAFALGNSAVRLACQAWMHGAIPALHAWLGVGLVVLGTFVIKFGGR